MPNNWMPGSETMAEGQYTRNLLFSTVFELMTEVVLRQQPLVHAAHQERSAAIGVSVSSFYNKLNKLELGLTERLVSFANEQAGALIKQLGGAKPGPLPGWRVKVLNGNSGSMGVSIGSRSSECRAGRRAAG